MSSCGMESLEDQLQFMNDVRTALDKNDTRALEKILIEHVDGFRARLMQALVRR